MAKKPKKAVDELFDEDAAPEAAPVSVAQPVSMSEVDQLDVLRRINRKASGVERDGRRIAIKMPNGSQFGLELTPQAGAVLKPSDVENWVRLA